jgi:hypothetical protein
MEDCEGRECARERHDRDEAPRDPSLTQLRIEPRSVITRVSITPVRPPPSSRPRGHRLECAAERA